MTERMARKRQELEDRLMRSAEELILDRGYASTTIEEIAAKADVSKGAVYLHYRDKADIYFSIVSKALEVMRDMFREAIGPEKTGLEKFHAIGFAFYDYAKKHPKYSGLLYDVNAPKPGSGSASELRCGSLNQEIGLLMTSSIELGMTDGSIRSDVDPEAAALTISTSLRGLLRTILVDGENLKRRGIDEEYLVDYALDLYGRSLMDPSGRGCTSVYVKNRKKGASNTKRAK